MLPDHSAVLPEDSSGPLDKSGTAADLSAAPADPSGDPLDRSTVLPDRSAGSLESSAVSGEYSPSMRIIIIPLWVEVKMYAGTLLTAKLGLSMIPPIAAVSDRGFA